MSHGYPDWGNLATSGASEIPTYRLAEGIAFNAVDATKTVISAFNPADSLTLVKLRRVLVFLEYGLLMDGAGSHVLQLYRTSTVGAADTVTPIKHRTTDPNSVMQCHAPVVSGATLADRLSAVVVSFERKTELQTSRYGIPVFAVTLYEQLPAGQTKALEFIPGQGFAVQITDPFVDGVVEFIPEWTEEPYS